MNRAELDRVAATFTAFHARFSRLFGRVEVRHRSEQYLRGLLVQRDERKNAENLSEAIEGASPRALQRMLTESRWPVEPVLERLQKLVSERLDEPQGVFVVDETGFPKQGKRSVGVARQYCGALGKIANCQVGVFLAYASSEGHALVDARLYLPEAWAEDRERRRAAGVPEEIEFRTKAELAVAMLNSARENRHLHGPWVTGDENYGQVPAFRDALDRDGWQYVLEVPTTARVFLGPPALGLPAWRGNGRPPTRRRLEPHGPQPKTVAEVAHSLADDAWETITIGEGAQGPRRHEFAGWRVLESRVREPTESRLDAPGREAWLVLRRNLDGGELKHYLSNAPESTPLETLARVGAARWSVETEFQIGKGQVGLDEYEVRSWRGWHHHVALSLLAGAFLLELERDWAEKHAGRDAAADRSGAGGVAAAAKLDRRGSTRVAGKHAAAQRARQAVAPGTAQTKGSLAQ